MIIKIKFSLSGKKQILPFNYQYPISSWIYKIIKKADFEFANILHENGYKTEKGKTFKFFTFSKLKFPRNTWRMIPGSDRMEIKSRTAYLKISFLLPEQTEKFVIGLFKEQEVHIGDVISGIDMKVENIETVKINLRSNISENERFVKMRFKTSTPLVIGFDVDNYKNEQYFEPSHPKYKQLFLQNLIDKYNVSSKNKINIDDLDFKIIKLYRNKDGKPKTELQTIKAYTQSQTKVKGYYFEFELVAPIDVIETGLNAGFGSMNALGFGFCELINS